MRISAYIPTFNNAATIIEAIQAVLAEGIERSDLLVVDDQSTDNTVSLARSQGLEVRVNPRNMGRGYTRALAVREAAHDLVLGCDATKSLGPGFVARALTWLGDPKVAAAFGRFRRVQSRGAPDRWEARHVFCDSHPGTVNRQADLVTGASVLRRATVLALGNFNVDLRQAEDVELGRRMILAGFDVVFDPMMECQQRLSTRFWPLMERYWRWHAGVKPTVSWAGYLRNISYSVRVLARRDLAEHDRSAVFISLFAPHYQHWRSVCTNLRRRAK